jgi:hypothetical protein
VVKDKRKTIPPSEAFKMTGFSEGQCAEGLVRFEKMQSFMDVEAIEVQGE